ncbi:hypothetical protein IC229_34145 [Spirosoma sp. BT702]|uniref:Uncharacterized protein n=1 Tax=Spirosoma profusum TaxID=2771354 RepID=A0A927GB54_9BACT|nr:hypothetical protein [Spirosoma profusum]MBD2705700.1 hypothetical protein [Spirosoma profusum]
MNIVTKKVTLPVRIEWGSKEFAAQLKADNFLFTTQADSIPAILVKLKNLLADYLEHEGKQATPWKDLLVDDFDFQCEYNLAAFFELYPELKISAIAARAGINPNLLQQYVSGNKRASQAQANKIQTAIHDLANELRQISVSH